MSLAPPYTPTASFANDETNQVAGRSTVRTVAVDTELANVATSINALKSNLEKLQRDDDKLRDFLVEPYALSEQTRALISTGGTPRGQWLASVQYAVGDIVQQLSVAYICYTAHLSSNPFTANGFWIAISGDGSAAVSAAAAAASEVSAASSAATATTQAGIATTQAGIATTQATASTASATAAGNSATAALASQTAAAASASDAAASFDSFDDRYLGAKAAAPTLDNDGNALLSGALYYRTSAPIGMKVYSGSSWVAVAAMAPSAFIETLLDDVDAAAARATLEAAKSGANADITSLSGLTTALSIAQGGTGQTTAAAAFGAIKQAATNAATGVVELATDVEAQAAADLTRALIPANLAAVLLGIGQTRGDFTASRAFATLYTNTTGRLIEVTVTAIVNGATNFTLELGPTTVTQTAASTEQRTHFFSVKPGETYRVGNAGALVSWYELR